MPHPPPLLLTIFMPHLSLLQFSNLRALTKNFIISTSFNLRASNARLIAPTSCRTIFQLASLNQKLHINTSFKLRASNARLIPQTSCRIIFQLASLNQKLHINISLSIMRERYLFYARPMHERYPMHSLE